MELLNIAERALIQYKNFVLIDDMILNGYCILLEVNEEMIILKVDQEIGVYASYYDAEIEIKRMVHKFKENYVRDFIAAYVKQEINDIESLRILSSHSNFDLKAVIEKEIEKENAYYIESRNERLNILYESIFNEQFSNTKKIK